MRGIHNRRQSQSRWWPSILDTLPPLSSRDTRQECGPRRSGGVMQDAWNAEGWHFHGAVSDSLKWFYYWIAAIHPRWREER